MILSAVDRVDSSCSTLSILQSTPGHCRSVQDSALKALIRLKQLKGQRYAAPICSSKQLSSGCPSPFLPPFPPSSSSDRVRTVPASVSPRSPGKPPAMALGLALGQQHPLHHRGRSCSCTKLQSCTRSYNYFSTHHHHHHLQQQLSTNDVASLQIIQLPGHSLHCVQCALNPDHSAHLNPVSQFSRLQSKLSVEIRETGLNDWKIAAKIKPQVWTTFQRRVFGQFTKELKVNHS